MGFFSKGRFGRKLVAFGAFSGIVGLGGGYVVYQRRLTENKSCTAETFNAEQNQEQLALAFKNLCAKDPAQRTQAVLYRYTTCPFCGTVKAFLDYYKVDHSCVEVEPMFKGEIGAMKYKKVPQVRLNLPGVTNGPMLVDSDIIVETLAPLVGAGDQLKDEEVKKWRAWSRNQLVRFLVLNINISLVEAWKSYDYIDSFDTIPQANKWFLKVMGAPVMYLVAQKFTKPKLVKSGDLKEGEDIRARLMQEVNTFVKDGLVDPKKPSVKRMFHGGAKPDLADLDVYGVLQSIRGHRVYNDVLQSTDIQTWLDAMDKATGKEKYTVA